LEGLKLLHRVRTATRCYGSIVLDVSVHTFSRRLFLGASVVMVMMVVVLMGVVMMAAEKAVYSHI
jgi:hypothetical protein